MHAAPDQRNRGILVFHVLGEFQRVLDLQASHAAYADEEGVADFYAAVILQAHIQNPHAKAFLLQRGGDVEEGKGKLGVGRLVFAGENKQDIFFFAA